KLRVAYPNNHIYFINYGRIASEMKSQFNAGRLPDIDQLVGRGRTSLYLDEKIGHAGPLMTELSALTWLAILYGADIEKLAHSEFSDEALNLTKDVIQYNLQFE
ncbi:MAG: hypothetical protein AAF585_25375, partial [Verrucomicrobiota bacterium]